MPTYLEETFVARAIHTMIRVLDLDRSFDSHRPAFGLEAANRFDFDGFTLVCLRNEENDFEIELTWNDGQEEPYTHGSGYGHVAMCVENCKAEHERFEREGLDSNPVKEFHRNRSFTATARSWPGSSSSRIRTATRSKYSNGTDVVSSDAA